MYKTERRCRLPYCIEGIIKANNFSLVNHSELSVLQLHLLLQHCKTDRQLWERYLWSIKVRYCVTQVQR